MNHNGCLILMVALLYSCSPSTPEQKTGDTSSVQVPESKSEPVDTIRLLKTEVKNVAGNIISTGYLMNGKKESSWIEFYDNGLIKVLDF